MASAPNWMLHPVAVYHHSQYRLSQSSKWWCHVSERPLMSDSQTIYADYQATTPVDPRVLAAMEPYWRESFGNPHSNDHIMGWNAERAVTDAADSVASLIGADASEVVFTSGATEANNLALLGLARRAPHSRRRILVSAIEHKSVLAAAGALEEREGFLVELIPVDHDGFVRLDVLEQMLNEDVLLVSVMAVNNEIGTVQSVSDIAELARAHGAVLHCDAAQAPCGTDVCDLADSADLLSLSGHKMYGPKGIGALYVRHGLVDALEPMIYGGEQQGGLRSGTVPVPLCVGMGIAAELLIGQAGVEERQRIAQMRDAFLSQLQNCVPKAILNGPSTTARHPGNANVQFPGTNAQDLLASVQPMLAASTGSACTSGISEPSHVLRLTGLTPEEAESSVRFSFGRFSTNADVSATTTVLGNTLTN